MIKITETKEKSITFNFTALEPNRLYRRLGPDFCFIGYVIKTHCDGTITFYLNNDITVVRDPIVFNTDHFENVESVVLKNL